MAKQNSITPKILKLTFILIMVFFLLVILFNFWIMVTLKDTAVIKETTSTAVFKPEIKNQQPSAKESQIIGQETKKPEIEYKGTTGSEGPLLLQ